MLNHYFKYLYLKDIDFVSLMISKANFLTRINTMITIFTKENWQD